MVDLLLLRPHGSLQGKPPSRFPTAATHLPPIAPPSAIGAIVLEPSGSQGAPGAQRVYAKVPAGVSRRHSC